MAFRIRCRNYRMGRICIGLNELRTFVRETELAAGRAFQSGDTCTRPDIVEAMNRLSSVILYSVLQAG